MFISREPGLNPTRRRRGMTLIEVVLALIILSLMAGAIYGIVSGSVESAASLALIQSEDRRVETFLDRTRLALAHLPAGATLELKILESEPLRQELTLRGVGEAYAWGDRGGWQKPVVTLSPLRWPEDRRPPPRRADLRGKTQQAQQVSQRFSLAMSVPDFYRTGEDGEPMPDSLLRSRFGNALLQPDTQGRFWIDLLPEVDRVEWRFYDPNKKTWIDQVPSARPRLIELRLSLPGRKTPIRTVFETA
jgi:prepilin-type N-terminal cleavage/methylation domain-containing protein